jgi:hypothetical protein
LAKEKGKGSRVYTYVKVEENANIHQLSILDKLRAVYGAWVEDTGRAELRQTRNQEALIAEELSLRGDAIQFLHKATEPIRQGKHRDVVVEIDKAFSTILEDVLSSPIIDDFYKVSIINWPRPEFDSIQYVITIRLEAK